MEWKQLLKTMVIPTERIPEEEEGFRVTDDATSSGEDPGEPSHRSLSDMFATAHIHSRSVPPAPTYTRFRSLPPSPARTRSYGKAKKTKKDREPFYKGFGVVYLPGDINGITKKLHLLTAEFFAGNTTVRNELVHVSDALLRLKQLTRKDYTDITARLAACL